MKPKFDQAELGSMSSHYDNLNRAKGKGFGSSAEDESMDIPDLKQGGKEATNNTEEATASFPNDEFDRTPEITKGKILKNIILLSFTFLLLFTCIIGLTFLQSSLHIQEGMGVITQSVYFGVISGSSVILPKPVIHILGHKRAMLVSMSGYVLWMAANGYAVWGTMIAAVIYQGLCASVLWTAKSAYFMIAAKEYAKLSGETITVVTSRFFGIFFAVFRLNGVTSAIIQTTVLHQGKPENYTGPLDDDIKLCGLNDCPGNNITNTNFVKPPPKVIWTLIGIYLGVSLLAMLIALVFVDNIPRSWLPKKDQSAVGRKKVIESIGATLRLTFHVNQILLIPLTICYGIERAFYVTEFYKSYTTCCLGMWRISLFALPGSIVNALTSLASGALVKYTGSLPIFITAMSVGIGLQMTLLFWTPHPAQLYVFILIPLFQGFADGLFKKQITALYGTLFPLDAEAAYSNLVLWESVGTICALAWSSHLCTSVKLYITMGFFYIGYGLLFVLYACLVRKKKNEGSN